MLQIFQQKKYNLTPNKLFWCQQDLAKLSFASTGFIKEVDEELFDSVKDHYKASGKAKPLADEEINNTTEE